MLLATFLIVNEFITLFNYHPFLFLFLFFKFSNFTMILNYESIIHFKIYINF
jgi:hypothetical protein